MEQAVSTPEVAVHVQQQEQELPAVGTTGQRPASGGRQTSLRGSGCHPQLAMMVATDTHCRCSPARSCGIPDWLF